MAWLCAALLLLAMAGKHRFLRGFFVLFAIEIALDAFASGPFVPKIVPKTPALETVLSVIFVILGDYRYFVLVESFAKGRAPATDALFGSARAWLAALPFALVVPVGSQIVRELAPSLFADMRKTFLLYEVMFLALALVMRFVVAPRRLREAPSDVRAWLLRLTSFEVVQYALWALADVVILTGHAEPGFLLRLVPNVAYYGGFLFFAWLTAPRRLRERD